MSPARRDVSGLLLLDKPAGMTSNAALGRAKFLLRARKAGHTGTLDPLATGLLPIPFGAATRFAGMLLEADKEYLATIRLGVTTTTGDREGEPVRERPVQVGASELAAACAALRGTVRQIPPMHSALKQAGRPLYELARQGLEVVREPREVSIFELAVLRFDVPWLEIRVRCSKGTYVRTLAEDIGEALGCGACLDALRRTATGGFHVAQAVTLEELAGSPEMHREAALRPVDALVGHLPLLVLSAESAERLLHGVAVPVASEVAAGQARLYGADGTFLGVGRVTGEQVVPVRLMPTGGKLERASETA